MIVAARIGDAGAAPLVEAPVRQQARLVAGEHTREVRIDLAWLTYAAAIR